MVADVVRLRRHDGRVVEGPERRAVEEPGGARGIVRIAGEALREELLRNLVVVDTGLPRPRRGAGGWLIEAVVDRVDARPAARVERHADDELLRRRAAAQVLVH